MQGVHRLPCMLFFLVDVAVCLEEPGTVAPHALVKVDPLHGSYGCSACNHHQPSSTIINHHQPSKFLMSAVTAIPHHTEDARDQVDLHHLDDLFLLPVGGLKECDIKAVLGNSGEILRSLDG